LVKYEYNKTDINNRHADRNFHSTGKNTSFFPDFSALAGSDENISSIGISATAATLATSSDEYNVCNDAVIARYSEVILGMSGCITSIVRFKEI